MRAVRETCVGIYMGIERLVLEERPKRAEMKEKRMNVHQRPAALLRALIAAFAAVLMVLGGLAIVPAANAAGDAMGLSVSVNKTSLATATESITYKAQIIVPSGTVIKDGGVLTLRLDRSVYKNNFTAAPAGAKAPPVWNSGTNTLTVTYGALASGSIYDVTINAQPSAIADASTPLQMHATFSGVTSQNGVDAPGTQTEVTDPITMPAVAPINPTSPGSWTMPSTAFNVYAGNYATAKYPILAPTSAIPLSSFRNAQIVVDWAAVTTDNGVDPATVKSWLNFYAAVDQFPNGCSTQSSSTALTLSCGAFSNKRALGVSINTLPVTATPGVYTFPIHVLDDADSTGATKIAVADTQVVLTVPTPAAVTVGYSSGAGTTQVAPVGTFDWYQNPNVSSSAGGSVTNYTATLRVPAGTTARGFSSSNYSLRSMEYTIAADPSDAAATWSALPFVGGGKQGRIDDAQIDPKTITGIRYSLNPFAAGLAYNVNRGSLTLQVNGDTPVGSTLSLKTQSVTYNDPQVGGGATTVTVPYDASTFEKTVTVVAGGTPPTLAGAAGGNGILPSLGGTFANGSTLASTFWTGSDGVASLNKPYQFMIVPKGVSVAITGIGVSSPYVNSFPYTSASSSFNTPITYPDPTPNSGSIPLADGATLYYVQVPNGQIGRGSTGLGTLGATYGITPKTALAGVQSVVMGVGSMTDDTFTVSGRNRPEFSQATLSNDASFGAFSTQAAGIRTALQGLGIATDKLLISQQSFTVSPSTSVGVSTSVKGSQDASPVLSNAANNYAGVGTTLPGGTVSYSVNVSNTGADRYNNFQFTDVLPYTGDTFTLNPAAQRGSQYDVSLANRNSVKVLINGVENTTDVVVEGASTVAPAAGDWSVLSGSVSGIKALRVRLVNGVTFNPGDTFTLAFDGTAPSSGAARTPGAVAKNTVAYSFDASGTPVSAESPAVGVKTAAVVGAVELDGRTFLDSNANGTQDAGEPSLNPSGVTLQLWKLNASGNPVNTGQTVLPNTDNGVDGAFAFLSLTAGDTYLVKPVVNNSNITIPSSALDADGFLKYLSIADASANAPSDTTGYVGSARFKLDNAVGVPSQWIRDLRVPLVATTPISGSVAFADKNQVDVTAGLGAILKDWSVALKQGATTIKTVTTAADGSYDFGAVPDVLPGDYQLVFTKPGGSVLSFSAKNNPASFTVADGTYALPAIVPGTGATGVKVFVTDAVVPTIDAPALSGGIAMATGPLSGTRANPTGASLSGDGTGSAIASFAWKIVAADSTVVTSGTAPASAPSIVIPASLADGSYSLVVTDTDQAGNASVEASTPFVIDKTAPVLTAANSLVTFAKGSSPTPTTAAGWIALFGITASDTGVGLPAAGGITVNSSAVVAGTAGDYAVTFTGTDAAGNATATPTSVTYRVAYAGDPTISLGALSAHYEMGTSHPADDAAWKTLFGGVTTTTGPGATVQSVTRDSSAVDFAVAGTYPVVFTLTDSLGYPATATGQLTVRDTTKPTVAATTTEIRYKDGDSKLVTDADWIASFGITATDNGSGVPAGGGIAVASNPVDYTTAGSYSIVFSATDNAGNVSQKTVTYVVEFAGAPTVTLTNLSSTFEMGAKRPATDADWIALFDASAKTAKGTTLASLAVDHSAVDFGTLSSAGYVVTFTATDSYGNKAVSTGQFVVQDTVKPEVSAAKTMLKQPMQAPTTPWDTAAWLAAFGVTATDTDGSGVDPASWTVTQGVNYARAGDYEVTFTVADVAGNTSKTVTVTLTLQAPPTADAASYRIAQDSQLVVDPIGVARTTGTLEQLTASAIGTPSSGGTAVLDSGKVVYTPAPGYSGSETLEVTVTDDLGQAAVVSYTFEIVATPKVVDDAKVEYSLPVDASLTIANAAGLPVLQGSNLTLTGVSAPAGFHGMVAVDGADVVFTSDGTAWAGDETFTFTVKDDLDQVLDVTVTLHVIAPVFTADSSSGLAGTAQVTLTASGLVAGSTYAVELHSTPIALGTITAQADGTGSLRATIPALAEPGDHSLVLLNDAADARAQTPYRVLAASGGGSGENGSGSALETTTTGGGVLSTTGATDAGWAGSLAALLAAAGPSLLVIRRRSRANSGAGDS